MIYTDPRTELEVDTSAQVTAELIGLVLYLKHHSAARSWIVLNGEEKLRGVCRALRARLFREGHAPYGRVLAALNSLDPPRCRCGRTGTRQIGTLTFCRTCGPPKQARAIVAKRITRIENASSILARARAESDTRALSMTLSRQGTWKRK